MRKWWTLLLGAVLGVNGLWMLFGPASWYAAIPGVAATGPANFHFIRDIGCAYLVAGLATIWLASAPRLAWPAALAGGGFLGLHAFVHLGDFLAGRENAHGFMLDLATVFLPAILVLWLAWFGRRSPATQEEK